MSKSKPRSGKLAVISLVLLCATGAALTVLVYLNRTVSTIDAQLLYGGEVMATFPSVHNIESLEGGMARVTVDGYGDRIFTGTVRLVHRDETGSAIAMIKLDEIPSEVTPPVPCAVTVEERERSVSKQK